MTLGSDIDRFLIDKTFVSAPLDSSFLITMRKEYFIEGKGAYERELVRLAVNASFEEQNICFLEARICPDVRSDKLARKINRKLSCIQDKSITDAIKAE